MVSFSFALVAFVIAARVSAFPAPFLPTTRPARLALVASAPGKALSRLRLLAIPT